jgi:recombination protein RecA
MKMVKNKVAAPFMRAEFDICVGRESRPIYGIDGLASLIDVAEEMKIVTRKGSHYRFGDQILGNGLAKASAFLQENPDIVAKIQSQTYNKAFDYSGCQIVDEEDPEHDPILDGDDLLDDDDD